MYSQTISDTIWKLLSGLNVLPGINQCYLAGGTALALQLGHRRSEDLDFFSDANIDEIFYLFKQHIKGTDIYVVNQTPRQIELMFQSVKVDLIKQPMPLKYPLKQVQAELKNIMIADPIDIGRMKILSIGSRGCKKDFTDLYCLTKQTIPLEVLINMVMKESTGIHYSKLLFLKGLVDFTAADKEPDPSMIWDVEWKEIKSVLVAEVMKIANSIK